MTTSTHPVSGLAWARLVTALGIKPLPILKACRSVDRPAYGRRAVQRWRPRLDSAAAAGRVVGLAYIDGPAESGLTYVRGCVLAVDEQHCEVQALPEFGGHLHTINMAAIAGMRAARC